MPKMNYQKAIELSCMDTYQNQTMTKKTIGLKLFVLRVMKKIIYSNGAIQQIIITTMYSEFYHRIPQVSWTFIMKPRTTLFMTPMKEATKSTLEKNLKHGCMTMRIVVVGTLLKMIFSNMMKEPCGLFFFHWVAWQFTQWFPRLENPTTMSLQMKK